MNALLAAALSTRHRVEVITFSRQYPTWLYRRITGSPTQVETLESAPAILPERLIDSVNPVSWFTTGREIRRRNSDLLIFRYSLPFFGESLKDLSFGYIISALLGTLLIVALVYGMGKYLTGRGHDAP